MSSPFTGVWKINLDESKVWDADKQTWISPDPVGFEEVTMYVTDKYYDQEILFGTNPTLRMTVSTAWDGDWVPYMVRDITYPDVNLPKLPKMELGPEAAPEIGQPYGWVKMMYINDGFHYRLNRANDGNSPTYLMSRRMHDDERSYTATVSNPSGDVVIQRRFDRH
ncbi:hypothetical protein ACFXG4_38435 [Nocardia sp. NPDC059246]|uniref:hypothetical protein n=1 Tax=unclassified Nocardia TaxID=2637762 RepID=UPI0036B3EF9E